MSCDKDKLKANLSDAQHKCDNLRKVIPNVHII